MNLRSTRCSSLFIWLERPWSTCTTGPLWLCVVRFVWPVMSGENCQGSSSFGMLGINTIISMEFWHKAIAFRLILNFYSSSAILPWAAMLVEVGDVRCAASAESRQVIPHTRMRSGVARANMWLTGQPV